MILKRSHKFSLLAILLLITLGWLVVVINQYRSTADPPEGSIPKPDIEGIYLMNTGSSDSPKRDGWKLFGRFSCPDDDQPCDWSTQIGFEFTDADTPEEPYPKTHLLTIEGGGIGREKVEQPEVEQSENDFRSFDNKFFIIDIDGEPKPNDQYKIFASFFNPDTNEEGEEVERTYQVGQLGQLQPVNL